MLLFEGTNEVLFHYGPMKNGDGSEGVGLASGSSATIGVESPNGQSAVPVAFEQAGVVRQGVGLAFLPRTGAPLPEGRGLGDLDGDGRVSILDQSRQVELTSPRYRPATSLELVAADVAPLDSNGALWGDGALRRSDRDVISQVLVKRATLAPYLSDLQPAAVAPLTTLTLVGSGFDSSAAGNNVVVLPRAGGGTLEVPAATATTSRLTLTLPADARRGDAFVRVNGRRTNARTLGVQGIPVILALSPSPGVIGKPLQVRGLEFPTLVSDTQVTIGGLPATVTANTAGPDTGLGATRVVTVTVPAALPRGEHAVVVASGARVSEPFLARFGDLPVVAITAPVDFADLRDRFMMRGTVQDADLERYELAWAPLEGGDWITFFTGTTQVTSGDLGTFDPTVMVNGFYRLRLLAVDAQGLSASAEVNVEVQGFLKVGNYQLTFTDVELPAAGIAIRVVREYDSFEKELRDFGYGWRMDLVTLDLDEAANRDVIVQNPESWRVEFRCLIEPVDFTNFRHRVRYVAREASERSTLSFEPPLGVSVDSFLVKDGAGNWFWESIGEPFDPTVYKLTQVDGTVLRIHDEEDLLEVIKPTGVKLTITKQGLFHSQGRSVLFTRDALGRVTKITDANGNAQLYAYDDAGDLVSHTDAEGFATTFTYAPGHYLREWFDPRGHRFIENVYDDAGRLIATVDPFGKRIEFEPDLAARREIIRDKEGRPTITEYDALGRAVKITGPDGAYEAYTYNALNRVLTRRDRKGKTWTNTYDAAGNQTSVTDPDGRKTEYTYDAKGNILTVKDPDGGLTKMQYDAAGHEVRVEDPVGGVTTRTYDASGNILTQTMPNGDAYAFAYDARGNMVKRTDPTGLVTLLAHDPNGNVLSETRVIPVEGQPSVRATTTYGYDKNNRRTSVQRPDGTATVTRFGAGGRPARRTESDGRQLLFDYDELGRLTQRIGGDGRVERREYDASGNLVAIEDEQGRRSGEVDARGQFTSISFPDGATIKNEYDELGFLTAREDARGNRWEYDLDAAGRVLVERGPGGAVTERTYNGKGQLESEKDPDGNTTSYEYDLAGRLIKLTLPDGRFESWERDVAGRVIKRTDVHGRVTDYTYGHYEDQEELTLPGGSTQYAYDIEGRVTAATDLEDRTTRYRYDPSSGARSATVLPLGQEALFTWSQGNLTAVRDFNGQTLRMEYDGRGKLVTRIFPDGSGERLSYDRSGERLETLEDLRGTTIFRNDAAGRLAERIEPDKRALKYAYDLDGNVKEITTPAGKLLYERDAFDRLVSVTDPAGRKTSYEYTRAGALRAIQRPNGVRTEYGVDRAGRLTRLEHRGPAGVIAAYDYEYDDAGNRSRVAESSGRAVDYRYDALCRLVSETISDTAGVTSVVYAYDAVGNRLSRSTTRPDGSTTAIAYTYDDNDRLVEETVTEGTTAPYAITYGYDGNGALLSRVAPGEQATYGYDGIGRLTSASVVRGAQRDEVVYRYDALGNRVETVRNGQVVRHLRDSNRPFSQPLVDTDAAGSVVATYLPGVLLLARADASGEPVYLLEDGQLSIRTLADGSGAVVGRYDYDAFGQPLASTGPAAAGNDVRYAGELVDPTTGLVFLRSRWLDPRTGRFMTRDTVEGFPFDPPTLHPYVYVLQNPINRVDPPGTFGFTIGMVIEINIRMWFMLMDLANAELQQAAAMRQFHAARMTNILSSLNLFLPKTLDMLGMDADFNRAVGLVTRALPTGEQAQHPASNALNVPSMANRTWLFGAKVHGRMGADLQLGLASRSGAGTITGTAEERLRKDRLRFATPEDPLAINVEPPEQTSTGCESVRSLALFQEIELWLSRMCVSGSVKDPAYFECQRDANNDQCSYTVSPIQFTAVASNVRWHIILTERDIPVVSLVDRLVANDSRAIVVEFRHDATFADFLDAIRSDGDVGPAAPFILSIERRGGFEEIVKDAIPIRNKPAALRTSGTALASGVLPHSGELMLQRTDLKVPGRGLDWEFTRVYRSGLVYPNEPGVLGLKARFQLGHNWSTNYDYRVGNTGSGNLLELDPWGRAAELHRSALRVLGLPQEEPYEPPKGVFSTVIRYSVRYERIPPTPATSAPEDRTPDRITEGGYLRRSPDGMFEVFNNAGWLVRIEDRFGNAIQLLRDETNRLRVAKDTVGRRFIYRYASFGGDASPDGEGLQQLLTEIEDETGQRKIKFEYDAKLDLRAVTSPGGRREEYTYSSGQTNPVLNHNLLSIRAPEQVASGGPALIVNKYQTSDPKSFSFDSVVEQTVGGTLEVEQIGSADTREVRAGGTWKFEYEDVNLFALTAETNAKFSVTTVTDRRGNDCLLEFNKAGGGIRSVDEVGVESVTIYNDEGQVIESHLPSGQVEYIGYDSRNPLPGGRGNVIFRAMFPAPGSDLKPIVSEYDFDPWFNQLRRETDTRGFVPPTAPPPPDVDPRAWLVPSEQFEDYTVRYVLDYEEAQPFDLPTALVDLWEWTKEDVDAVRAVHPRWAVRSDLGDLNHDGSIGVATPFVGLGSAYTIEQYSKVGFRGLVMKREGHRVKLTAGSHEAQRLGAQEQRDVVFFQHNAHGQVTVAVDPEGNVVRTEYYAGTGYDPVTGGQPGYVRRTISDGPALAGVARTTAAAPVSATEYFEYDRFGFVRKRIDEIGTVFESTWSPDGVVTVERQATNDPNLSYVTRYEYDGNLNRTRIEHEDKGGFNVVPGRFFETRYVYDICNDVVEEGTRLDEETWLVARHQHDENQNRTLTIQPEGNRIASLYDPRNLVMAVTRGSLTAEASTERYEYTATRKQRLTILADGDKVVTEYDAHDRVRRTVAPDGSVTVYGYDEIANVIRVERHGTTGGPTPSGNDESRNELLARTERVLDSKYRIVEEQQHLFGSGLEAKIVVSCAEYDRLDRTTVTTEPDGELAFREYDGLSRVIAAADALGNRVETEHDAAGNPRIVRSLERAEERVETYTTTVEYDALNRRVAVTDNAGQVTRSAYDSRGNVVLVSDPVGEVDPETERNGYGNLTRHLYDAAGRHVQTVFLLQQGGVGSGDLANPRVDTSNQFNPDGLVTLTTEYDRNSRPVASIDDNGNRTQLVYDALDRVTRTRYADGTEDVAVYNVDDTVQQVTDANGTVVRKTYDVMNRLVRVDVQRGPGVGGTTREEYEYDGLGRATRASDNNGFTHEPLRQVVEAAYDSLSRPLQEQQNGRTVRATWSDDGKRLTCAYPGGRLVETGYDGIDRPTSIADVAGWTYAGPGLRALQRDAANGTSLVLRPTTAGPTPVAAYDAVQRIVQMRHVRQGNAFVERHYTYNRAGARTSETRVDDGGLTDRWEYDSIYRIVATHNDEHGSQGALRGIEELAYQLDGAGNRRLLTEILRGGGTREKSYEVNALNQYTEIGDTTQSYTRTGNLRDDGARTFTYDYRNRLIAAQERARGEGFPLMFAATSPTHWSVGGGDLAQAGWTLTDGVWTHASASDETSWLQFPRSLDDAFFAVSITTSASVPVGGTVGVAFRVQDGAVVDGLPAGGYAVVFQQGTGLSVARTEGGVVEAREYTDPSTLGAHGVEGFQVCARALDAPLLLDPETTYHLEVLVSEGGRIQAKLWKRGEPEPESQLDVIDPAPYEAGAFALCGGVSPEGSVAYGNPAEVTVPRGRYLYDALGRRTRAFTVERRPAGRIGGTAPSGWGAAPGWTRDADRWSYQSTEPLPSFVHLDGERGDGVYEATFTTPATLGTKATVGLSLRVKDPTRSESTGLPREGYSVLFEDGTGLRIVRTEAGEVVGSVYADPDQPDLPAAGVLVAEAAEGPAHVKALLPSTTYRVEVRAAGARLEAKVWVAGTVAPSAYQLRALDPSPLGPGLFGLCGGVRSGAPLTYGSRAPPARERRFFYDGEQICEEQDAAGNTLVTYVYDPSYVDEVLEVRRTAAHPLGAGAFYIHQTARHDVVAVTDGDGDVVERRTYDDFGRAYDETKTPVFESLVGVRFAFQGRELDSETRLYHFRARTYDPETGRFLQRDPVTDPANFGNLYTFAGNSPATQVDPSGEIVPLLIAGAAIGGALAFGITLYDEVKQAGWGGVNWANVALKTIVGAVSGAVGALASAALGGAGLMAAIGGGLFGGAAEGAMNWAIGDSDRGFLETVGRSATLGALFGGVLHGGFAALGKVLGPVLRGAVNFRQSLARCRPEPAGLALRFMRKVAFVKAACFLAGTFVETSDGKRTIEHLRVGDEVLSRDEHTGQQGYKKITRLFRGHTDKVVYLRIAELLPARQRGRSERHDVGNGRSGSSSEGEDGSDPEPDPRSEQTIRSTVGHPYYVAGRGWVHAKDLTLGDQLCGAKGEALVVVQLEIRTEEADHYNFEVDGWHSYFVAASCELPAVWTHNTCLPKSHGHWSKGVRGNGVWTHQNPVAVAWNNGKSFSVPFRNNHPVFRSFVPRVKVDPVTGNPKYIFKPSEPGGVPLPGARQRFGPSELGMNHRATGKGDFAKADKRLEAANGWPAGEGAKFREANGLTWHHHQNQRDMLLVPIQVHNASAGGVSHAGGVSASGP